MAADCLTLVSSDDAARLARAARFAELAAAMLSSVHQRRASASAASASASAVDGLLLLSSPSLANEHHNHVRAIKTHDLLVDSALPVVWRQSPASPSVENGVRSNRRPIVASLQTPTRSCTRTNTITIAASSTTLSAARAGPRACARPPVVVAAPPPTLPPTPSGGTHRRRRGERLATMTKAPGATAAGGLPPPPRRGPGGGGGGGDGGANNNNNSGRSVSPAAANAPTAPPTTTTTQSATLSIATLNLRGVMDRWRERRPVLAHAFKELDADVLCMQEVLTGEAGQEAALLRPLGYGQPLPCRAALANLAAGGGASGGGRGHGHNTNGVGFGWPGVAFAAAVRAALAVPPLARAMAALPAGIEAWREKRGVAAPWARAARDAAMAPFFGNSIAVRSGGGEGGGSSASASASASASSSWPPLLVASSLAEAATTPTPPTPSSWPRTPGEFLAAAFGRCCGGGNGSSPASPPSRHSSSRVWVAGGHEVLVLGGFRAAHRVMVGVRFDDHDGEDKPHPTTADDDQSAYVWVVNAHLDHADPATRAEQAAAIIRWMGAGDGDGGAASSSAASPPPPSNNAAAVVLAGDFNAPASEQGVHGALKRAGFVSAYASAHGGKEPAHTWPTGLQAPLADDEGEPHCADYVYVRELKDGRLGAEGSAKAAGAARRSKGDDGGGDDDRDNTNEDEFRVRVLSARVAANEPWPADPTLYPSDHAAVRAVLKVERKRRRRGVVVVGGRRQQQQRSRDAAAEEGF